MRETSYMETGGGTKLWCPKCDQIRVCKVLWYDNLSKGNFVSKEFPDLHWRERPRECNICGHHFSTYEIENSVVDELIELRKLILEIKRSIEAQQEAPTPIAKFLGTLEGE